VKKLQDDVKGKINASSDPKTDEEKLKIMGLKTTSNIQALIRDLYHPNYKTTIHLSWVTEKSKFANKITTIKAAAAVDDETKPDADNGTAKKRHAPITFTSEDSKPAKQARNNTAQKVYAPPSGKYSGNVNLSNRGNSYGNRSKNNNRFRNNDNKKGFRKNYNRY
jgi:hypothetical protein